MSTVTVELKGMNSFDIADCTRTIRAHLGSGWTVSEIDRSDDHHSPLDFLAIGLSGVQCALAGIAIWLQIREGSSRHHAGLEILDVVRKAAKESGASETDVRIILAALLESAERVVLDLPHYRLIIRRRGSHKFEVRGKQRKRKP